VREPSDLLTFEKLEPRLSEEGIDPDAYDLEGSGRDEAYCLERSADGWVYYYRERDIRRGERVFESEDDAVQFFLTKVLNDPTTRRRR
jgi:hypothetical protein